MPSDLRLVVVLQRKFDLSDIAAESQCAVQERRRYAKDTPVPIAVLRPLKRQHQIFWELEFERVVVPVRTRVRRSLAQFNA